MKLELNKGRITVRAQAELIGNDLLVAVYGGDAPHIGSVSMAEPRPSLADPLKASATISTYNFMGHLDDVVGDKIAKCLCAGLKRRVVVTCGIHADHITPQELKDIGELTEQLCAQLKDALPEADALSPSPSEH